MTYNPVDPRGRLRRLAYLPTLVVMNLSLRGVQCLPSTTAFSRMVVVLGTIFVLWIFYCTWAKRLHDIGRSGRLAVINVTLVSAAGVILNTQSGMTLGYVAVGLLSGAMIIGGYLLIAPPSKGANRYGADPRTVPFLKTSRQGHQGAEGADEPADNVDSSKGDVS